MIKTLFLLFTIFTGFFANGQANEINKEKLNDFLQNQQFDEAIDYLTPAFSSDSNNIKILGYLAYANYMDDKTEIAATFYQKIYAIDSNNISAARYLTLIYSNKNPETAKIYARRLTILQPGNPSGFRTMGELLRRTNQKDSALIYATKSYVLDAMDPKNAICLSEILLDMKNYVRADSVLEVQLAYDSLNITLLKLRVRAAYEENEYLHGLKPGERLIQLNDVSLSPLTQLALSYYILKRFADCIRVCEYMIRNELTSEAIFYYEAKAYANQGNLRKSNELLETCLSKAISLTAESYYYNLGQNYEGLHQYRDAVSQYDTAYYLFKNPVMAYNAGRLYESRLNDMNLAKKYYLLYLRNAKPKTPEEKKAFEFVKHRWGGKRSKAIRSSG
jgi:tetratricopeptide (TPR) repeat protein